MEARLAALSKPGSESNTKTELVEANNQVYLFGVVDFAINSNFYVPLFR